MIEPALTRENIEATHCLIAAQVRRTPVIEVDGADFGIAGVTIVFKLEYLQHAGSFKARGAFTHLLTRAIPEAGVVAASGGNHGAATAFAAQRSGKRATIFVPTVASPAKIGQIRGYGADLRIGGDRYADALVASEAFAQETGALRVHAYDQIETLLGQGTVALEFEQQAPGLDAVLVAVGGGGLIGGMAAWYRGATRLIAVEPENAPTLAHALAAGEPVDVPVSGIAADSLGAKKAGALMFPLAQ
jgi:threonine dehydratase